MAINNKDYQWTLTNIVSSLFTLQNRTCRSTVNSRPLFQPGNHMPPSLLSKIESNKAFFSAPRLAPFHKLATKKEDDLKVKQLPSLETKGESPACPIVDDTTCLDSSMTDPQLLKDNDTEPIVSEPTSYYSQEHNMFYLLVNSDKEQEDEHTVDQAKDNRLLALVNDAYGYIASDKAVSSELKELEYRLHLYNKHALCSHWL